MLVRSVGTGRLTRSGKVPTADALLKKILESLGNVVRPSPIAVKSARRSPKTTPDATITRETGTLMPAEFKVPPPSRKRKLVVVFPKNYGSPDTPSYKLWMEVDRMWVPASRERQQAMSPVAATVENVSDA